MVSSNRRTKNHEITTTTKPHTHIRWQNTYIVQEMEQYWYHFITSAQQQIYCIGSFVRFHNFNFNFCFFFHLLVCFSFFSLHTKLEIKFYNWFFFTARNKTNNARRNTVIQIEIRRRLTVLWWAKIFFQKRNLHKF